MKVVNDLIGYKGMKVVQNTKWFSFSLDSVLLPRFVTINKNVRRILDIGTGNAPIPLILSTRTKSQIYGIEIQKDIFELELKTLIQNYFDQIGKSEYEFEFDKIKNFISVIEDKIKIAEENKKQKGDLYFKLSLAVGVVIGVLIW